ncbi:MAG: ATP-binding protein [Clostridium sp.]|nr:ATP-binding protein [Clostridium sp.]
MKKKLLMKMLGTLLFILILVSLIFTSMINYQYETNMKDNLKDVNASVGNVMNANNISNKASTLNSLLKNSDTKIAVIDKNNKVIFSNIKHLNLNNMNEVKDARSKGNAYFTRYSEYENNSVMYYARLYGNGYVIDSSHDLTLSSTLGVNYLKYYLLIILISVLISTIFGIIVANSIIKPIRDLEFASALAEKGELNKRASVQTDDEFGKLSKTFNHMAEKLQISMKDAIDKQNKMEAILKSMDSGVIAVDNKNKVMMINPYAELIFGINQDIIGRNLIEIIRDFDFEEIFKKRTSGFKEIKILWPKERNLRIRTADIISDSKHIGTVAVIQDVTGIKKLENMRTQFVANVSHELKTPLTSIKGFSETIKYVEDEKQRIKFLNIIDDEVDRLTRLINDTLTLSHIEIESSMKREEFYVDSEIESVYCLMKNTAKNKNIDISIVKDAHVKLLGDRDMFKQMIINLVDNAIKYSEEKDSVYIGSQCENNVCVIWVQDTGIGIAKEHQNRIFERFYRVDKARSRAKGGTGLGLAIVKHIVLNFGGSIKIESEVNKGTKFIIKLPCKNGAVPLA